MPQQNQPGHHRFPKRSLMLALLSVLAFAAPGRALTLEDLVFYASFDKELQPGRQPDSYAKTTVNGKPELVPGHAGQALRLRNGLDAVHYCLHTYEGGQGTIAFWLSAGDWDASSADALQVLLEEGNRLSLRADPNAVMLVTLQRK